MVAQPETLAVPTAKTIVLSQEEILTFIPHGASICGLDQAWYDDEETDTVFAQHTITEVDCAGHFENDRFSLLICPLFRTLEWLGQLTCLSARLRFGVRAELGAFTNLTTRGLLCFLRPGDRLILVSKILTLSLSPNGQRGKGAAEGKVWWQGFAVLPSCIFDFVTLNPDVASRLLNHREGWLKKNGAAYDGAMQPPA